MRQLNQDPTHGYASISLRFSDRALSNQPAVAILCHGQRISQRFSDSDNIKNNRLTGSPAFGAKHHG